MTFVDIADEELKPKYMRSHGEIPESKIPELNGIANEIHKKRGDDAATKAAYENAIELGPRTYLAQRAREYLEGLKKSLTRLLDR